MTKAEAKEYLHVSIATIDRLIGSRAIAHIKIGKKVLLKRADLDAFLRKRTIPAKAAK